MTGRERYLSVLSKGKPDRLPCQVHGWMEYYLKTYLSGMDQYRAYDYFEMDPVIYVGPEFIYDDGDLGKWEIKKTETGISPNGNHQWASVITTPEGALTEKGEYNQYTGWTTEHIIKNERDFDLWSKYFPLPAKVDWTPVIEAKKKIGDRGIVRGSYYGFGQGSPWQSFAGILHPVEDAIMLAYEDPDLLHHILKTLLDKKNKVIGLSEGCFELDLVETGGGAGSSTVISPAFMREFCLPYDIIQHKALHDVGTKVVYHLCGGLMPMLELVAENGADGLETMTPPEMGGDCDLAEASKRVGDKLFFIGGFDQHRGFEAGSPEKVKEMVYKLFSACPQGGYICSPSDHFFFGAPENVRAFVEAAKECVY